MASQSSLVCAVNLFKREYAEAIHSGDDLKEERINSNGQIDENEEMIGFSGTSQQHQPPTFESMCFEHSGNLGTVRLTVRKREQLGNGPGGGGSF